MNIITLDLSLMRMIRMMTGRLRTGDEETIALVLGLMRMMTGRM